MRTADAGRGETPALIEVYPHIALLSITGADYRVPYKVSKTSRHWPGQPLETRRRKVASVWRDILAKLQEYVCANLEIPAKPRTLAALKRYEDALDALVCARVGIEFLADRAEAMGDAEAAIWSG